MYKYDINNMICISPSLVFLRAIDIICHNTVPIHIFCKRINCPGPPFHNKRYSIPECSVTCDRSQRHQFILQQPVTKLAFRSLMWIAQLWYTEWSSSGQTTPNSPCIIPYSIRNAHSNMPFLLILVFEIGHWEHNSCDDWCASIARCLIADILSTAIHAGCFPTLWYTYWVWAKLVLCVTCPALLLLPSSLPALFALVFCYFGYCPDSSREKSIHIDSLFSCSKRVCLSISLL